MNRWGTRLKKLEDMRPEGTGVWYGLVRYAPPEGTSDWVMSMLAHLGWSSSTFAMIVVDANDSTNATPAAVIAPTAFDEMSDEDLTRFFAAGRDPGRWFLVVTGRGAPDAMPMHGGSAAFIRDLRDQIGRSQGGYFGQL